MALRPLLHVADFYRRRLRLSDGFQRGHDALRRSAEMYAEMSGAPLAPSRRATWTGSDRSVRY